MRRSHLLIDTACVLFPYIYTHHAPQNKRTIGVISPLRQVGVAQRRAPHRSRHRRGRALDAVPNLAVTRARPGPRPPPPPGAAAPAPVLWGRVDAAHAAAGATAAGVRCSRRPLLLPVSIAPSLRSARRRRRCHPPARAQPAPVCVYHNANDRVSRGSTVRGSALVAACAIGRFALARRASNHWSPTDSNRRAHPRRHARIRILVGRPRCIPQQVGSGRGGC